MTSGSVLLIRTKPTSTLPAWKPSGLLRLWYSLAAIQGEDAAIRNRKAADEAPDPQKKEDLERLQQELEELMKRIERIEEWR